MCLFTKLHGGRSVYECPVNVLEEHLLWSFVMDLSVRISLFGVTQRNTNSGHI